MLPKRPVFRHERERLVIAGDGFLMAFEAGQRDAEAVPRCGIVRIGGQRALRIRARRVITSQSETRFGRDQHDNRRKLMGREHIRETVGLR